jgi:argininosuccinate lyase
MKALPLSYNRDMQEDKEGLFDTVDTLLATLQVFTGMVSTLKVKAEKTHRAAEEGYALATDLADYLVGKGIPFREAHSIVSKLVQYATEKGKSFPELSISEYKDFSPRFEEDVYSVSVESAIAARNVRGGTAPGQVTQQLKRARQILQGEDA